MMIYLVIISPEEKMVDTVWLADGQSQIRDRSWASGIECSSSFREVLTVAVPQFTDSITANNYVDIARCLRCRQCSWTEFLVLFLL